MLDHLFRAAKRASFMSVHYYSIAELRATFMTVHYYVIFVVSQMEAVRSAQCFPEYFQFCFLLKSFGTKA